jgi:hypothetical protein
MTVYINPGFLPPVVTNRTNRSVTANAKENPLYPDGGRTFPHNFSRLEAVVSSGAAAAMKNQFEASQLLA